MHVVVVQALGDVEDPLARDVDPLEGELEVALGRLVLPACWAVTIQSKVTPSRRFEAANRSSSQFVMTPSRKRRFSLASASAESGNAGQSPTEPPNGATSSSVGSTPSSAQIPRSDRPRTSR